MTKKELKRKNKAAKKAAKKSVGICLRCAYPLRRKDARCPNCKRASPLYVGKASGSYPYLVKSAGGNVTPIWSAGAKRPCWNGCPANKATARHCVTCGADLALSHSEHTTMAVKSARNPTGSYWLGEFYRESNPARAEELWALAQRERAGEPVFIPKAAGAATSHAERMWREATTPAERELWWYRAHPEFTNPTGGQAS